MNQRIKNRIAFVAFALFVILLLLMALCSSTPHQYADFNCPVCYSDHVLVINEHSDQCPDCGTSFLH